MGFFDRLAFGWRLGTTSLGVVARDKTLMLFPILSGIVGLALLAAFVFGIGPENLKAAAQAQQGGEVPPVYYVYAMAAKAVLAVGLYEFATHKGGGNAFKPEQLRAAFR